MRNNNNMGGTGAGPGPGPARVIDNISPYPACGPTYPPGGGGFHGFQQQPYNMHPAAYKYNPSIQSPAPPGAAQYFPSSGQQQQHHPPYQEGGGGVGAAFTSEYSLTQSSFPPQQHQQPHQQYQHPGHYYQGKTSHDESTAIPFYGDQGSSAVDGPPLLSDALDRDIRHAFVRKVYLLLSVQLIITFGLGSVFAFSSEAKEFYFRNYWLSFVGMGLMIGPMCALSCSTTAARKYPLNYALLTTIAVAMGLVIGLPIAVVKTSAFLEAVGLTVAATLAITVFACQSKWDFTGKGVYMFVAGVILTVFGLVCLFVHDRIVNLVYGCLGALVFSGYLLIHTQQTVGGKNRKYQLSIDDYVLACLLLYLDIINLFTFILRILAASDRSD